MSEFCVEAVTGQKNVTIEIATEDFEALRQGGYSLCLAKKLAAGGVDYDVVWRSSPNFLPSNTLSWIPDFQLFATNQFAEGQLVNPATNVVVIGQGETSTLDQNGILHEAVPGGPPMGFVMVNEFGPIHPGLNQWLTWIDGSMQPLPIFVLPYAAVPGTVDFQPIDTVLVWFEPNIETSTIFMTPRTNAVEIDLTDASSATRLYSEGAWSTP
ncbi:hypothetical protein ACCC88_05420 [Sphingomonas sp. Sphisp140]|uniref:hypothetical protein n=1 Tax=unclassified Sphingomonas TaxID=196159 RepID=UPI0039B05904